MEEDATNNSGWVNVNRTVTPSIFHDIWISTSLETVLIKKACIILIIATGVYIFHSMETERNKLFASYVMTAKKILNILY